MTKHTSPRRPEEGPAPSGPRAVEVPYGDWRAALPVLSSHGVTLREAVNDDALSLLTALSDEDLTGLLPELPASSASGFATLIERLRAARRAGGLRCWVVVPADAGIPVGLIGLRSLDQTGAAAEAFAVLANEFRGSSVFQVAARLALNCFFGSMAGHRIEFRVDVRNGRASGAIRKLGALQEGILRRARRSGDDYHDQVLWAIVASDWHARGERNTGVH